MLQVHIIASLNYLAYEASELLTAVVFESSVFWDITQCSPLKVNGRFTGMYHHHIQG
jgi:hypothetical protein